MEPRIELPACQLTEHHFRQAPVWRFIGPDEVADPDADESYVRAHETGPVEGEHASYLISATFTLKNGAPLPGFVEVGVLGKQVECTPGAVFAVGKSIEALGRDSATRLERILKVSDAQPVGWKLDVCICGETKPRNRSIEKPGALQALALLAQLGRLRRYR
jgi:hypothetical protein